MASVHANEQLLFSILLQLIVMIGAARMMNAAFRAMGQPGVIGEIVAGLLLGPSLFGHFFPGVSLAVFGAKPSPAITMLSQIGLILLMFQIGADFDFGHLRSAKMKRAVLLIAVGSIVVPFGLGLWLGFASQPSIAPGIDPVIYALFCGVALAITAVPILGRILREFRLTRTPIGVVAISAAAINDVVGWVMLACISAYATAVFSGAFLLWRLVAIAVLLCALRFVLAPLVDWLLRRWPVVDGRLPANLMAVTLCIMFGLGIATYQIGIFAIFGGFAAGLLFHRHTDFVEAWSSQVGHFTLVFFLPVFFTFTGLRTNLLGLSPADLGWLVLVLAAAVGGKIVPVFFASRAAGFDTNESSILASLMNTRALMELIVLNIGYDLGFLPQNMFTMLVVMAVVTTLMTGPLLRLLLPRTGHVVLRAAEA
ncbi:cation:proton antiporter [Sphingomonas abietis]|uniref:Cation:proton antiporter n=1 Tax=Sphingomonas abietis TaxID=3012344 RepID=A0ABY7NMR5_9SPHN|nr:cation:proton antiporter [Sphingomonas abietis]WBO22810.1 cation:proton antiporter [Sphingomonas abietis]